MFTVMDNDTIILFLMLMAYLPKLGCTILSGAQSKSGKVYASQDDATNCTFAPKIKKNMNLESHQQEGEEMVWDFKLVVCVS